MLSLTLLHAVYTSLVLFFIPFGVFYNTAFDYQTMAVTVAMAATFTANIEVRITLYSDTSKRQRAKTSYYKKKKVLQMKCEMEEEH